MSTRDVGEVRSTVFQEVRPGAVVSKPYDFVKKSLGGGVTVERVIETSDTYVLVEVRHYFF